MEPATSPVSNGTLTDLSGPHGIINVPFDKKKIYNKILHLLKKNKNIEICNINKTSIVTGGRSKYSSKNKKTNKKYNKINKKTKKKLNNKIFY